MSSFCDAVKLCESGEGCFGLCSPIELEGRRLELLWDALSESAAFCVWLLSDEVAFDGCACDCGAGLGAFVCGCRDWLGAEGALPRLCGAAGASLDLGKLKRGGGACVVAVGNAL